MISDLISVARPGHWFKNIFMLPGIALAFVLSGATLTPELVARVLTAIVSTCAIASAYYTINEWLDAEFDRFHPLKKDRPSAAGRLNARMIYSQWAILNAIGLGLALLLGPIYFAFAVALVLMSLAYNIRPIRTKDRMFLDVLSESVNNPLRFMLGWTAVAVTVIPPSSILLAYWMGGAYLMAVKRFSEYRYIDDPERAGLYRRSFRYYTEETLLLSAVFYAVSSAFFFGVFLIKYRVEFLLTMPGFALLFVWYLSIGMRRDSVAQRPEKLYHERRFMIYVVALGLFTAVLFFVDIPFLNFLVEPYTFNGN
ncbi:MAG: UbiA family prenyltransferase [Alphaproteobacteria bacterium]